MINKKKTANIILIFLIILLVIFQVVLLNRNSTMGKSLASLQEKISIIESENERYNQKIASASSFTLLSIKAKSLGYEETANPISLASPLKFAYSD